jgi:hypothetical protein
MVNELTKITVIIILTVIFANQMLTYDDGLRTVVTTSNITNPVAASDTSNNSDTVAIIVAIIALVSSGGTATLTAVFNGRQTTQLENLKSGHDTALKDLESRQNTQLEGYKNLLERQKSEEDARREYEYESRKNLYQEFEPLLFQLNELSDRAYRRIIGLARDFRNGNLEPQYGWLSDNNRYFPYYSTATLY